jgi:lipopolysaccharide transport system ATP-binding protein
MKSRADSNISGDAIAVHNVTKKFKIPHEQRLTIFDHIFGLFRGGSYSYEEFVALNDVSFSIAPGETLGIIGSNGSGKSTLLKILAGIIYPDSGSVKIHGKIAPFIELGVGFQPELTARNNIFLYGAIMGVKKRDIRNRYDEILEFAELKKFQDMRLKNLSSGMILRLAFSTAIQSNPDILLVDEILSVGDEAFQQKCNEKIIQLKKNNKTIVYVSHELETVRKLCNRCILLENGNIVKIGGTHEVIEKYLQIIHDKEMKLN